MRILFAIPLVILSAQARAQVSFTADEVRVHQERIELITDTAAKCLDATYAEHVSFFRKYGVSKFYGDRRKDYETSAGRAAALRGYGLSEAKVAEILPQMKSTSCVGMTMDCLKKGFAAAGQSATWDKIYAHLKIDNKFYGTDLQKMLRGLGWRTLYWNPLPAKNAVWDAEDLEKNPPSAPGKWMPVWGGHAYRYNDVMKNGSYYKIPIDDRTTLVNFDEAVPQSFKRINFFVGTAHAGYHVFPGRLGQVIEAHSMREISSYDNLEYSDFNPLATGGGPRWTRTERYRSGVIVVPPGR